MNHHTVIGVLVGIIGIWSILGLLFDSHYEVHSLKWTFRQHVLSTILCGPLVWFITSLGIILALVSDCVETLFYKIWNSKFFTKKD